LRYDVVDQTPFTAAAAAAAAAGDPGRGRGQKVTAGWSWRAGGLFSSL